MNDTLGFVQSLRGWEWIIILVLALVLFGGAKKLPDAARGLGRALRIFKSETKGLVGDDGQTEAGDASMAPQGSESTKANQPTA